MKRFFVPILAGLLALDIYGQKPVINTERSMISEETQESAKKSGDFYIYSAREDLESALLRTSEAWKWRQDAITKADYLTSNNIETNLAEYVLIAGLRHNAAIQERNAGNLVIGAIDSIKKAQRVYSDNEVKSRADPPSIEEYIYSRNCFLRAEDDIRTAINYYQMGKNNLGEASLREALAADAKQKAEEHRQKILKK